MTKEATQYLQKLMLAKLDSCMQKNQAGPLCYFIHKNKQNGLKAKCKT